MKLKSRKDSQNKLQVIALQEVWGTEVDVLEKAVVSTHKVFPGMHSISLFGIFANLINSVRYSILHNDFTIDFG